LYLCPANKPGRIAPSHWRSNVCCLFHEYPRPTGTGKGSGYSHRYSIVHASESGNIDPALTDPDDKVKAPALAPAIGNLGTTVHRVQAGNRGTVDNIHNVVKFVYNVILYIRYRMSTRLIPTPAGWTPRRTSVSSRPFEKEQAQTTNPGLSHSIVHTGSVEAATTAQRSYLHPVEPRGLYPCARF
jgi:hypothetical protein